MIESLPEKWQYLKVDLFNNATPEQLEQNKEMLKLSISIQKTDGSDWLYFRAAMNSPKKNFKRGIQPDWSWAHYRAVQARYDTLWAEYKPRRINISKCYSKGYAKTRHTIEGLSAAVFNINDEWYSEIYYYDHLILVPLSNKNLSLSQRKTNIIATGKEVREQAYTRTRARDLLG